jgi:hypothetical protein
VRSSSDMENLVQVVTDLLLVGDFTVCKIILTRKCHCVKFVDMYYISITRFIKVFIQIFQNAFSFQLDG